MKIRKQILDRISCINWFENCGNTTNPNINVPFVFVESWEQARDNYQLEQWENATLEARNRLTEFLHKKYQNQYSNWNKVAKEAKDFINVEVVPKVEKIKEKNQLDKSFLDCVKWDILNANMEDAYSTCNHRPIFFLELLTVYESGNFPCGWNGSFPKGSLKIF